MEKKSQNDKKKSNKTEIDKKKQQRKKKLKKMENDNKTKTTAAHSVLQIKQGKNESRKLNIKKS